MPEVVVLEIVKQLLVQVELVVEEMEVLVVPLERQVLLILVVAVAVAVVDLHNNPVELVALA
jgi:hypothetical protein